MRAARLKRALALLRGEAGAPSGATAAEERGVRLTLEQSAGLDAIMATVRSAVYLPLSSVHASTVTMGASCQSRAPGWTPSWPWSAVQSPLA